MSADTDLVQWRKLADFAIRDGESWNDRRLPEMGRALTAALDRLAAAEAQRDALAADLAHFGRHVPPCPRWITSGELPDGSPQPCFCGFAAALAAVAPAEDDTCLCGHPHVNGRSGSCSKFTCVCNHWIKP